MTKDKHIFHARIDKFEDTFFNYEWAVWLEGHGPVKWPSSRRHSDTGLTKTLWGAKREIRKSTKAIKKFCNSNGGPIEYTVTR